MVGSAGSKGSGKSALLNKIFDTDFGVGRSLGPAARPQGGVALCAAQEGGLLCVDYDAVGTGSEEAATNGKILALTTKLADVILLNLWSSDVGRNVPYNTLALQAIFQEQLQAEGSPKTLLVVTVHDHDTQGGQDDRTREAILEDLEAVWAGVPKAEDKTDAELGEFFDVEVAFLPHPRYRAEEYEGAVEDLRNRFLDLDLLSARYSKRVDRDTLPAQVAALWNEIKARDFVVLPSRGELLATHQIEAQYALALATVESKLTSWRAAAERGRVLGGFGEAAAKLYADVLDGFDRATQPFAVSPLRIKKHKALQALLTRGLGELVRRQLANLQAQGMKRFKATLLRFVGREDREDLENVAQKELEEWFGEAAEKVVVAGVAGAGSYEKALSDFINQLTDYAHKWPQSPAYNIQAMKKLETGAQKKKGKASWGATFQLVSLLRTPGDGALQGFATYQAGPVQFLCGLQNDRDLPESRVEGKVPPLLRIQPKVAFDVDL